MVDNSSRFAPLAPSRTLEGEVLRLCLWFWFWFWFRLWFLLWL